MHIQKVEIRNIKFIRELVIEFETQKLAGWHVLIGDNGSGKSTVLKAIALPLIGVRNAFTLSENWAYWPRTLNIKEDEDEYFVRLLIRYNNNKAEVKRAYIGVDFDTFFSSVDHIGNISVEDVGLSGAYPADYETGAFSAAYGPFRRFTGGSEHYNEIFKNNPKLAAHLSIFNEGVALSESIQWLQDLRFRELEERETGKTEGFFLDKMHHFINQDEFLPFGVQLQRVSSSGVYFTDANGSTITVQNLSDGYHSILSMTFDIIRQMQIAYQTDDLFSDDFKTIKMPGVVLIDEVDAHLHPTWQRKIGGWFRQHFPNVQFIVTTHSPLICQAAAEGGSVWKLPRPGTDEKCVRVTGQDLNRLLYGNILEAYSTQLFGIDQRSEQADEKLERLAALNVKEVFEGLTEAEQKEQEELRAIFPTASNKIEQSQ